MRKPSNHGFPDISDLLDNAGSIDAIIIYFSKAFDLVPQDRMLTKITPQG
jgi:hypothetical protein